MKKFLLITLMVLFAANTVAVAAWAKPCQNSMAVSPSQGSAPDMAEMPCHGEGQDEQQKHCEGICLCLHAAVSQQLLTPQENNFFMPVTSSEQPVFSGVFVISHIVLPPQRPPKFIA